MYIEEQGLRFYLHDHVYSPKEDSFLLLDAWRTLNSNHDSIIEVGCGSGFVIIKIAKQNPKRTIFATDLNFDATTITKKNVKINQLDTNLHVICTNYAKPFRLGAHPKFTIFNPPYLPEDPEIDFATPEYEKLQLIGGETGVEVLSDFLYDLIEIGSEELLTIISSLATNPIKFAKLHPDWYSKVIYSQNLGFETIWVLHMQAKGDK